MAGTHRFTDDVGAALLIWPVKHIQIPTNMGEMTAMGARWYVLDGPSQGEMRFGTIIPTNIVESLNEVLDAPENATVARLVGGPDPENPANTTYRLEAVDPETRSQGFKASFTLGW